MSTTSILSQIYSKIPKDFVCSMFITFYLSSFNYKTRLKLRDKKRQYPLIKKRKGSIKESCHNLFSSCSNGICVWSPLLSYMCAFETKPQHMWATNFVVGRTLRLGSDFYKHGPSPRRHLDPASLEGHARQLTKLGEGSHPIGPMSRPTRGIIRPGQDRGL